MAISFGCEHNLSFVQTSKVIELAKEMARDPKALQDRSMSMAPSTVSYKLRFGLALSFQEELYADMRMQFFSLNLDEATSLQKEKIFT